MAAEGSEDHLVWEERQRGRAAIAAAVAALGTFTGTVSLSLTQADLPRPGFIEGLSRAPQDGPIGGLESQYVPYFEDFVDQSAVLTGAALLVAVGLIGMGWALTYLAVATRARRPALPKAVLYLPIVFTILKAIAVVLSPLVSRIAISDFLDGPRTVDAAQDISGSGLGLFIGVLNEFSPLGIALAFVLIALNAMRVGLLTRFMGVLGIVVGALQILPFGGPLPVVQCFWLVMLSILYLGRSPGGVPPAWRTGKAEPWPSGAALREQRARAAAERRGEPFPEPEPVGAVQSPARKRKRKRR